MIRTTKQSHCKRQENESWSYTWTVEWSVVRQWLSERLAMERFQALVLAAPQQLPRAIHSASACQSHTHIHTHTTDSENSTDTCAPTVDHSALYSRLVQLVAHQSHTLSKMSHTFVQWLFAYKLCLTTLFPLARLIQNIFSILHYILTINISQCGMLIFVVVSVCLSLTFESFHLENSCLVCRYTSS